MRFADDWVRTIVLREVINQIDVFFDRFDTGDTGNTTPLEIDEFLASEGVDLVRIRRLSRRSSTSNLQPRC